jgi:hypothetical protein
MKKHYYSLTSLLLITYAHLTGSPVISFFFKPLPDTQKMAQKLKNPGKIAKHTIHGIAEHNQVAGICATYSGYIDTSDANGEISFPRKHRKDAVEIIITTQLEPIPLFENTIKHWQLLPETDAVMYSVKELYDEKSKEYNWHTQKVALPSDRVIPQDAIVIIAKPTNIVIPLEITKTIQTANLTLPPLYVKKGINIVSSSAYMLNIRHLFRPVESQEKRAPLRLTTLLLD